jgi:type IV pilus assembly protein PilB
VQDQIRTWTETPQGPRALADLHGVPFVDLRAERIDREALDAIPLRILVRTTSLPYRLDAAGLKIAVADPADLPVLDELRLASRHPIQLAVAAREEIEFELRRLERSTEFSERAAEIDEDAQLVEEADSTDLEAPDGISEAPPIRLVNSVILQAADEGASDIHFVPRADGLAVRLRLDGVMHEIERIPKRHARGVVTRVKVLAKLDVAEHRRPQDGRISVSAKSTDRTLDVRVAVIPTVEGEGVIMRLLEKSRSAPTLTEIGLSNEMQMQLEQLVHKPTGALLVTGPTGCGKSTTVYAALEDIRRPEINIITVEDPVEYRLEDVYQLQVNPAIGVTFASALRSILRSDPDVVMVGEIRDLETAKISLEAAMTGHLVLSTLHTSDAPGAVTRLTEMGIEPFVTGSAITAVLAQRLVRRLCLQCREPWHPGRDELVEAGFSPAHVDAADGATLYRKRGCPHCAKGFRGRVGIYQLMVMNAELRDLASQRANGGEIERAALASGMRSLWDDGVDKVLAGLTTVDELERVLG